MKLGTRALRPETDRPLDLHKNTRYFATYEAREEAFARRTAALIARKHAGPRVFWEDFARIRAAEPAPFSHGRHLFITSNPRESLAFGTPRQILTAAHLDRARIRAGGSIPDVETTADRFEIQEALDQPLRSLSGGETLKLCCARAFIAVGDVARLTIASPFCWLSRESGRLLADLVAAYERHGIPVELLALEGEDSPEPIDPASLPAALQPASLPFSLRLAGVRIPLGTPLNSLNARPSAAAVADFSALLRSPCLLVGENGQGKSLVSRVLARAVSFQGTASLDHGQGPQSGRLLFQDVVNQTLLRPFSLMAASSGDPKRTLALFGRIGRLWQRYFEEQGMALPAGVFESAGAARSLLEIKALLAAARLCHATGALILDEPDWGLTRQAAVALVAAISRAAHELTIPVILISHKPWWPPFCASVVAVSRSRRNPDPGAVDAFRVNLCRLKEKRP